MADPIQAVPKQPPRELLIRLEQSAAEKAPKKKDFWEKLQAFASILTPLVIVYFTYQATGQLDNLIKQRQLEITSASAMSKALGELMNSMTPGEADRHAIEVASYGPQALLPLTYVLQDTNDARAEAARKGIELLSSVAHPEVCRGLVSLLANQTGLYRLSTQEKAVAMIGKARCANAAKPLADYKARLDAALAAARGGNKRLAMFADEAVGADKLKQLQDAVERALKSLASLV